MTLKSGKKAISTNPTLMSEIVFAEATSASLRERKKALAAGTLRKVTDKIYTTNLNDPFEFIIKKNWKTILGHMYPEAVISYRTAFELKPSPDGDVFLTYSYSKKKKLPGLNIHLIKGPNKYKDDIAIPGGLYLSSDARKALENLEPAHRKISKIIDQKKLEHWLETLLNARGESALKAIRDRAKVLALSNWKKERKKLSEIIGALLATQPTNILVSDVAKKRAQGSPYDLLRDQLFDQLFTELKQSIQPLYKNNFISAQQRQNFAFFESYFSNFIEGTEFEIDEAKEIIFDGMIPTNRPKDGHDILGVYQLASDAKDIKITPSSEEELIHLLKIRHHTMLSNRPEIQPGQFKEKNNRAGETHFVNYDLVKGTLRRGFQYYKALPEGFQRAAFMMFLVSEVHPFVDGNGRIARLMMNAELSKMNLTRILIPIVYREDYLLSLKKLSRQNKPETYIRMLEKAYRYAAGLIPTSLEKLENQLSETNAFKEPDGNQLII